MGPTKHYHLLRISPDDCPPNHYVLLGIPLFEQDPQVIFRAALRRTEKVRKFQISGKANDCQKLVGELATARTVLGDPVRKFEYDAKLQEQYGLKAESQDKPITQTRNTKSHKKGTSHRVDTAFPGISAAPTRRRKKSSRKIFGTFTETQVIVTSVSLAGFLAVALLIIAMAGSGPDRVVDNNPPPSTNQPGTTSEPTTIPHVAVQSANNPTSHEASVAESATESSEARAEIVPNEEPEEEEAVVGISEPTESASPPEGWVPFESFPLSIDLLRFSEQSGSFAGVTHLAGKPLKISYESLDPQSQVSLREEGGGQWTVVTGKDGDAPVASLRHEGNAFIWEWNADTSKNTANSLHNGFLLFKSDSHEKRIALRKARVADSFTWNFNDAETRNKAAVARRSCVVDGVPPKEILFLEVQLPNGNIESGPATRLLTIQLPKKAKASPARLTAKWTIKLQSLIEDGEEGNEELSGDTKIILEQRLQIIVGGSKIPATMKKIHERDKQLHIQLRKAIARKAKYQAQFNVLHARRRQIEGSGLSQQKKNAILTPLNNQIQAAERKFDIADSEAHKMDNIIKGAAQFGANVLRPLKGNGINYRVYLQRKGDEKQIDVMRSWEEGLARTHLEDALFAHMILRYKSESLGDCYKWHLRRFFANTHKQALMDIVH